MTAPLTDSDADALDVANRVAHELTPHAKRGRTRPSAAPRDFLVMVIG